MTLVRITTGTGSTVAVHHYALVEATTVLIRSHLAALPVTQLRAELEDLHDRIVTGGFNPGNDYLWEIYCAELNRREVPVRISVANAPPGQDSDADIPF